MSLVFFRVEIFLFLEDFIDYPVDLVIKVVFERHIVFNDFVDLFWAIDQIAHLELFLLHIFNGFVIFLHTSQECLDRFIFGAIWEFLHNEIYGRLEKSVAKEVELSLSARVEGDHERRLADDG